MIVRFYQESDRQAWDEYITQHPQGTFFHLTGWKTVVENSFGHNSFYLVAKDGIKQTDREVGSQEVKNTIVGIFPIFSIKSFLFARSMISVPFASYGGILAENRGIEKALYEKALDLTRKENGDYLEIRNQRDIGLGLPTKDLYYSFKKEIFPHEDDNLKAVPRKTRRMVRVGMSKKLESTWGGEELLDEFYNLFAFSYRGFGTPVFSKAYLSNLLREFDECCNILIIRKNGKTLSGVLSFFFKDEVIPYYSGAYPAAKEYAANDFLYWTLMCIAMDRGCRAFDFGRSKKDTGPFHFKRHWGFQPKVLHYQYYLHKISELPDFSPWNSKYRRRIEFWKKMPLWATKLIGPHIVKNIPSA